MLRADQSAKQSVGAEGKTADQLQASPGATEAPPWQAAAAILPADIFAAYLTIIPAEDLGRTWPADRTIMLRLISKRVKELVDKVHPPAVVQISETFRTRIGRNRPLFSWHDSTTVSRWLCRLQHILLHRTLERITVWCRITVLDLSECGLNYQGMASLTGVLASCPALSCLYLYGNQIGAKGAGSLAGVMVKCTALSCLLLWGNQIGAE